MGCNFEYAIFERTQVDREILEASFPGQENLRMRFARTLRVNFQQLGDAKTANQALSVELEAAKEHFKKGWKSKESYYRNKYKGKDRARMFWELLKFSTSDFIWGNGESIAKLLRSIIFLVVALAVGDVLNEGRSRDLLAYPASFCDMSAAFLGVYQPTNFPHILLALITFLRFVAIGAFVSILVKRHNQR